MTVAVVVAGGGDGINGGCSGGVARRCFVTLWCVDEGPGLFNDREEGSMFFGRCSSSLADCSVNTGHLLQSELVWFELDPHDTQWLSLGEGQVVVVCSFVQVMQHSSLRHLSLICPYSWHLLHLISSKMSLLVVTHEFKMNTR